MQSESAYEDTRLDPYLADLDTYLSVPLQLLGFDAAFTFGGGKVTETLPESLKLYMQPILDINWGSYHHNREQVLAQLIQNMLQHGYLS